MPDIDAYSSAIGTLYEAGYGVADWSEALSKLTDLVDGSRSWLFHTRPRYINAQMSVLDEGFHSQEGQAAAIRDPLFDLYRSRPVGTIVRHSQLEDVRDFRRRELWQDWLRMRDLDFGLHCTLVKNGNEVFYLDLNRSMKQGDFTDTDVATVSALAPHILRAGEISAIVGQDQSASKILHGPVAVLVVDGESRIVDMNPTAAAMLDRHALSLGLSAGRMAPPDPDTARRLHRLVSGCARKRPQPGGLVLLANKAGSTPTMVASVAPFSERFAFGLPEKPLAAVFLRDMHGHAETALDDLFASLFRLPPAHARLARLVMSGIPLRQAAIERGISYATARTYLDHIFRQTGTSRQPELVALLKTVAASITP